MSKRPVSPVKKAKTVVVAQTPWGDLSEAEFVQRVTDEKLTILSPEHVTKGKAEYLQFWNRVAQANKAMISKTGRGMRLRYGSRNGGVFKGRAGGFVLFVGADATKTPAYLFVEGEYASNFNYKSKGQAADSADKTIPQKPKWSVQISPTQLLALELPDDMGRVQSPKRRKSPPRASPRNPKRNQSQPPESPRDTKTVRT